MNNKKVLELVEICLTYGLKIKIEPDMTRIRVSFKVISMSGAKLVQHTIHGVVTDLDIELVRDVVTMITAGDTLQAIEKRVSEFVPF